MENGNSTRKAKWKYMTEYTKLKSYYGRDLAKLLADKVYKKYPKFQKQKFIDTCLLYTSDAADD